MRLCRQLGIDWPVKLIDTVLVEVPTLIGWLRPIVLWPPSLIAGLSVEQFEAILAHELAHVRRHDYLVNLFQTAIETVLFYHPAVWWISKRIRHERECCCDDLAIAACGNRLSYARALAALEQLRPRPSQFAVAADGGQLLARIRRIAGTPTVVRARNRHWILGFTLSVAVVATIAAASISTFSAKSSKAADEPKPASAIGDTPIKSERLLRFPSDRTMGIVYWRKGPAKPEDRLWMYGDEWKQIGEARGEVRVPVDGDVRLQISKAASSDMSGLDQLEPDQIQALDCCETDLNNEGMRHIGRLTGLKILYVFDTPITDACAPSFAGLKELQAVRLEACKLYEKGFGVRDDTLKVLGTLPKLEQAWMRDAQVTDAGVIALAHAKSLRSLCMEGTKVTDACLPYLKQLPHLETLWLGTGVRGHGPNITDRGMETIGEMTILISLDLSGTKITDEGLVYLRNLARLKNLKIDNTRITEAALVNLAPLQSLESVRLYMGTRGGTAITDVGAAHLAKLKALRQITAFMDLTDKGVAQIATLPMLEDVEFDGDGITDASAPLVGRMKSLKWLEFQNCRITDKALASLSELKNLEIFRVWNTRVTGEGLKYLKNLPKLSLLGFGFADDTRPRLQDLRELKQINRLELRGDHINIDDLKYVAELGQLQELDLTFPVDDRIAAFLPRLTNLTQLDVREGTITDATLKQIAKLKKLTALWIMGDFTDDGLTSLTGLKSLWVFTAGSSRITDAGIHAIQKDLPALQFVQHSSPWKPPATLDDRISREFDSRTPPVAQNRDAREHARLADGRVLIVFANPKTQQAKRFFKWLIEVGGEGSYYISSDYRTLAVSTAGPRRADAIALAAELGVELPAGDAPLLVAEGADGKVLGKLQAANATSGGKEFDAAPVVAFVRQHIPPQFDGRKLFADALAQAKRENKRVFVQETAVWCGPCHRLAEFLDKNRPLWEKDYIWVRMDIRWPGATKIMQSLRGDAEGGYPWYAILGADGKVLATCNSDTGENIGFPGDKPSIDHFIHMFSVTAQRMTPAEIAALRAALSGDNATEQPAKRSPLAASKPTKATPAEAKSGDKPVKNATAASQEFMQLLVEQLGTNEEIQNGPSQKVADVIKLLPDVASVSPCVVTVQMPKYGMMAEWWNGWPSSQSDSDNWEFLARKFNIPKDRDARNQLRVCLPYGDRVLIKAGDNAVVYQADHVYFGFFVGDLGDRMQAQISKFMKLPPAIKALIVNTNILRDNFPSHVSQLAELTRRIKGTAGGIQAVYLKPGDTPEVPFGKMEIPDWQVVDDATGKPIEHFGIEGGRADPKDASKVEWGYYTLANAGDSNGKFSTTIDWYGGWRERIVSDGYIPQPILTKPPQLGNVYSGNVIRLKRALPASKQDFGKKHAADQPAPASEIATSQRPYTIEPPDTLLIDTVRLVPKSPYKIQPLDDLAISVYHPAGQRSSPPDNGQEVIGAYRVEPDGSVNLGSSYGKVHVAGLTLEAASDAVAQKLQSEPGAKLSVKLIAASSQQQIGGEYRIGPDGTVNFGTYGSVYVAGMDVVKARTAIEEHLKKYFEKPVVAVDVSNYASKVYYIIEQGTALGETWTRVGLLPGNETVLDAIAQIKDLPKSASTRIWISRPTSSGPFQRLDVDWDGITKRGEMKTNFLLNSGDRVTVEVNKSSPPIALPAKH